MARAERIRTNVHAQNVTIRRQQHRAYVYTINSKMPFNRTKTALPAFRVSRNWKRLTGGKCCITLVTRCVSSFEKPQTTGQGRAMAQMFLRTCSVCGQQFMAKRADANICNKNSTCRVRASRAAKKARQAAERMTLPLETYHLFELVCETYPCVRQPMTDLLAKHGGQVFGDFLIYMLQQRQEDMLQS